MNSETLRILRNMIREELERALRRTEQSSQFKFIQAYKKEFRRQKTKSYSP